MAPSSQPLRAFELPYRWAGLEGAVRVEIGENVEPTALGCAEFARGFPTCRATVEPPARGYLDMLGWVQMYEASHCDAGFTFDDFEPLGRPVHPFGFYGASPTFFDAPHWLAADWDFLAHTFLCGLGGELLEFRHEVRAVLGFSWGFHKRGEEIEYLGPDALAVAVWDGHLGHLRETFPDWTFLPGFRESPLGP